MYTGNFPGGYLRNADNSRRAQCIHVSICARESKRGVQSTTQQHRRRGYMIPLHTHTYLLAAILLAQAVAASHR